MTKLLVRLFIKGDPKENNARTKCGTLGGIVGIICNLLLFAIKLFTGLISGSVSIIADAFNNLTDMGSSVVTMLGFKLASKPADRAHPFGHGRMEYMSASFVSVIIILVGIELLKEAYSSITAPKVPETGVLSVIILTVSILVKLWMSFFNRKLGKMIDSAALFATASDSLNDCISTGTVLAVSLLCWLFGDVPFVTRLDPIVGLLVALFIIYSGIKNLKETLDPLIGLAPEAGTVEKIKEIVLSHDMFLGIHDMIVHNYGPGRSFVSLHVEVSANVNVLECHELIDHCEREITETTGIEAVIHMDPIVTDDEFVNDSRACILEKIAEFDSSFSIHDFRMVKGQNQNNLIFDVCVPPECKLSPIEITDKISALAKEINPTFCCIITVDNDFSGGKHGQN